MFKMLSQWWMGLLYSVMGQWVVDCVEPPNSKREVVMRHVEGNHGLIIFCEEIRYKVVFKKWWIRNVTYTTYKYTAVCTGVSPVRMRKATEESVYFPEMFTSVFNRSNSKKHMLNVFVKVIVTRMRHIIEKEETQIDSSSF